MRNLSFAAVLFLTLLSSPLFSQNGYKIDLVYWDKVRDYLDRLFIQQPDTLTKVANELIAVAKVNTHVPLFSVETDRALSELQQHGTG